MTALAADPVPPGCLVEDWCLKKATPCFFGYLDHPQGLYRAHARYSVVRKMWVVCNTYYGRDERRVITSPVEPVEFSSGVETSADRAQDAVMGLCERYRGDWVSAAPVCR